MQTLQLELPENFKSDIDFIKSELQDLKKHFEPKSPNQYLTRQQVAELLSVDISTVHNWSKRGKLQKYSLGGKVFYKRNEVEGAIIKLNN
ncbi:helix-turn-helix domain-containing protein [Winogradskyella eximia]|uniref:helix-turn-helix domain-containing protein n=1 Tax=Winogradskyella eximia TaxID=262006 RepID=UPI002490BE2B|nr:helix-turn-helix domain-containing protein [Winogradskyella eximia]